MPKSPRVFDGPMTDAYTEARQTLEPLFVPAGVYADDRGWSLMNLLKGVLRPEGQVNYSVMYPQVIKAWHFHRKQTDFWLVTQGHIKAGIYREDDHQLWSIVMGERKPGVLVIPPPLWHGAATVGHTPAGMFYYVDHQYNPNEPDEFRRDFDAIPEMPWQVQHR